MLDQTVEDAKKALAAIAGGASYSTSDVYAGSLLVLVENEDCAPDNRTPWTLLLIPLTDNPLRSKGTTND